MQLGLESLAKTTIFNNQNSVSSANSDYNVNNVNNDFRVNSVNNVLLFQNLPYLSQYKV